MTWLSVDSWLLVTSYNSDRLHQIYGSCNAPTAEGLHCDEVSLNAVAGGSWGTTDAVGTNAKFDQPFGLSTSPDGSCALIDCYNSKIRKMIVSTWVVSTLAGNGGSSTNADGVGTNGDFVYPVGVDISTDGLFSVVVCDSSIRRIVISTALVTTLGGRATAGSTDGVGTNVEFSCPMDGAISNVVDGSFVLITDMDNYLIR
jgi:hypothetical protein